MNQENKKNPGRNGFSPEESISLKFKKNFRKAWSRLLQSKSAKGNSPETEEPFFMDSSTGGDNTFDSTSRKLSQKASENGAESAEASFPLISEILHEGKYEPLVEALKEDGILRINQLQGTRLVYYVNSKNLYPWRDRAEIFEGISEAYRSWKTSQDSQADPEKEGTVSQRIDDESPADSRRNMDQKNLADSSEIFPKRALPQTSRVASSSLELLEKPKDDLDVSIKHEELPALPILQNLGEKSPKQQRTHFSPKKFPTDDFFRAKRLGGCNLSQVSKRFKLTKDAAMQLIAENNDIIEIQRDTYIHRENIVGFDEAAARILDILRRHFKKFLGYSSSKLLYDAVNVDMPVFLNDNDFFGTEKVFFFAKHLFSKMNYKDNCFFFYENLHIWEEEPDYPGTKKGILIHYARKKRDLISLEECDNYLQKVCLPTSNIKKSVLHITEKPTFLQYDEDDTYLLGEFLNIDDKWILSVKKYLQKLCAHRSYVILRDIEEESLEMLPKLSYRLSWTKLLLQEILGYYPECGYRTIPTSLKGQKTTTLHAAIVSQDSSIETFPDLVEVLLVDELAGGKISWKGAPEELRKFLLEKGVLKGNELYNNMHTVLDDYRFAWTRDKSTVTYFLRP